MEPVNVDTGFRSRLRRARESLANAELLLAQGRIAGTITVLANAEDEIRAARIRLLVGVEPVGGIEQYQAEGR